MTDRRLKLFPRDEAGNIIRRPLYAHFLLRASRTERGMKILFQPAMRNGALRELPVCYPTEIQFHHTPAGLAGSIGYHRDLHFGQQFNLRGGRYICLTIYPTLPGYHKACDHTHATSTNFWKFTENSLRLLRKLPIMGFNPRFDGFSGAIK